MSHQPLLSIIIPNYNNAKYLGECLDSVVDQTYRNIEIIVSDDCSTDNSQAIIQEYEQKYPGKIQALYLNENHGVSFNRNHAIHHAKGEYLATLDSDDYYCHPQKLEKEMELVMHYKRVKHKDIIAFSGILVVTSEGRFIGKFWNSDIIKEGMIFEALLTLACMVPRNFVVIRKAYDEVGGFDVRFRTHQTWDIKLRLAAKYECYFSGIDGIAYRQHDEGLSSSPFWERTQNWWAVFNKNIELVSDEEHKQELTRKFALFMRKRQQHEDYSGRTQQQQQEHYRAQEYMRFKNFHHIDQKTINAMYDKYAPVFILTTGRSGSKFIALLMNHSPNIIAHHEAYPTLQYFPNFVYHHQNRKDILARMFDAARMELILDAYNNEKVFVESNQCLTFFAPAISELFPRSKFVHIVRHPADFVRSAIRKGWHKKDSIWETGRVRMRDEHQWEALDQLEKLCWLWQTTNQFIEKFKRHIDSDRIMTFRIEDIFENVGQVQKLLQFVGAKSIAESDIRRIQRARINELHIEPNEPPNIKRVPHFPVYPIWDEPAKETLKRYCAPLSQAYGYILPEKEFDIKHLYLLSVIIPNYNNEKYLKQCLDSILEQTYSNIEIIVSDDCSTDNSRTIIQEYEKKYPDKVRGFYLKKNSGVAFNRNYAIQQAKGEYITTLDSDDYYENPQKLEKEMELILYYKHEKQKDIIAFSDIMLVTGENQFIRYQSMHENIREGMMFEDILTRTCMIPRDFVALRTAYLENGGYEPKFTTHEDWDLKIRLAAKYEFYYTGINGTVYRQHDAGLSSNPFKEQNDSLWRVFKKSIDNVSDHKQKQELIKRFSMFMDTRQQDYLEYLKYRFYEKLRKIGKLQAIIFCISTLLYDFGVYGFLILLRLLSKKLGGYVRRFVR